MSTKTICKCGHAIHEHTYSEDFSGCDVVNCECSLDLGGLIDLKDAELLALRERVAKLETVSKNFLEWAQSLKYVVIPAGLESDMQDALKSQ